MVAAVAYAPLIFAGYGSDVDAYALLEAAARWEGGGYSPSRQPGFPVHEWATAALDAVGGSVATNAGTAVMALVALGSFLGLARRLGVPHRAVLGLTFALHPVVWATAAATIDYAWALGFALAGGVWVLDRRWAGGGVLLALAIGARATTGLVVLALLGYAWWSGSADGRRDTRGVALATTLALGLGGLCYVPVLAHYGWTLDFLVPVGAEEQATWSWAARLGRFGYKTVYLWGLPAAAWIAWVLARVAWKEAFADLPARARAAVALGGGVVAGYGLLFLRYPLEMEYLLPTVPFLVLALGVLASRRALLVLGGLTLLYAAVSLNVARPDRPLHATRVDLGLWLEPGYLATDVAQRLRVRECRTIRCWHERSQDGAFVGLWTEGDEQRPRPEQPGPSAR